MPRLFLTSENANPQLMVDQLMIAESFWHRAKGLLGRKKLLEKEALWIKPCNNIHTFFMNFPIDCVFVDKRLKIVKLKSHINAFKIIGPFWKAHSVFEMPAGSINQFQLKTGDQFYVVD